MTYALFGLYLGQYQWLANDTQINALLFVSKIHEALILTSLSNILFHRIRHNIMAKNGLSARGIPFGLLTAPFQLNNPLYLIGQPFLASTRSMFTSSTDFGTAMLVIIIIILASLTGPSSGIIVLPKLDWWPFPNGNEAIRPFRELNTGVLQLDVPLQDIFPDEIGLAQYPFTLKQSNTFDNKSFTSRFNNILDGIGQTFSNGRATLAIQDNGRGTLASNVSFLDGSTMESFPLYVHSVPSGSCSPPNTAACLFFSFSNATLAVTSPLSIVTQQLSAANEGFLKTVASIEPTLIKAAASSGNLDTTTWKQPRVALQCTQNVADASDPNNEAVFNMPAGLFSESVISITSTNLGISMDYPNNVRTIFFNQSSINSTTAFSMGFIAQPKQGKRFPVEAFLCLADIRWVESEVWAVTPSSSIFQSGNVTALPSSETLSGDTNQNQLVKVHSNWADSINDLHVKYTNDSGTEVDTNPFARIWDYCATAGDGGYFGECQMAGYAMLLTDTIRRLPLLQKARPPASYQVGEAKTTKLYMRLYHQIHAYQLQGTLIQLAWAVLLLHTMLVYAHLLVILLGGGWNSRAWTEFGDLIALAISTAKPRGLFKNCSVGVKDWETWRLRTSVREVGLENRLEFVFGEEEKHGRSSVPKPDWHYD